MWVSCSKTPMFNFSHTIPYFASSSIAYNENLYQQLRAIYYLQSLTPILDYSTISPTPTLPNIKSYLKSITIGYRKYITSLSNCWVEQPYIFLQYHHFLHFKLHITLHASEFIDKIKDLSISSFFFSSTQGAQWVTNVEHFIVYVLRLINIGNQIFEDM